MAKITLAGHSFHAIINDWPIALLSTSFVFDALGRATRKNKFEEAAKMTLLGGILTGTLAALSGVAEYTAVERKGKLAVYANVHAILNAGVMTCAVSSYFLRRNTSSSKNSTAFALSGAMTALTVLSAWYGDEMVYGERVRVHDQLMLPNAMDYHLPGDEKIANTLKGDFL
jgi:uncharacterized membrane protein